MYINPLVSKYFQIFSFCSMNVFISVYQHGRKQVKTYIILLSKMSFIRKYQLELFKMCTTLLINPLFSTTQKPGFNGKIVI